MAVKRNPVPKGNPDIPLGYQMDLKTVTVELQEGPDGKGRHHFTVYWWNPDFHTGPQWRAQCFHANYSHQLEYWRKQGRRVVVVR